MNEEFSVIREKISSSFEEINLLLGLLKEGDNASCASILKKNENQLILKSAMILMLYNAIEGTMKNILETFFDTIKRNNVNIDRLNGELQERLYKHHLCLINNNPSKLKKFKNISADDVGKFTYDELNKYNKFFSGNLDARAIKK